MLTGTPAGKRPLGRPRRRWEDNIRMDIEEIGMAMRNWADSAHYRYYWRALEPPGSISYVIIIIIIIIIISGSRSVLIMHCPFN